MSKLIYLYLDYLIGVFQMFLEEIDELNTLGE